MAEDPGVTREAALSDLHRVRLTGATVTVVSGPDAGLSAELGSAALVVGSGDGCDVRLADPLVSRRHLELRAEPEGVRALDLGSRNGTLLGAARIKEALLEDDTTLVLGDTAIAIGLKSEALDVAISPRTKFGDAIAHGPALRHVFELLERAAKGDVTVLLEGDSGTGKDVLAQSIHQESRRREGPFVVVDCGAIPEALIESELFGHEKGAFTGATIARPGAFEQANGGTVFLDEIGELPLDAQPKLLRALENRSFRRVGGQATIKVDVRVVAATNRRLREAVRKREFREDLFYRLAVVHVSLPRLSERPEDVLPLAERFLRAVTGRADDTIPPDLARLLRAYDWPGNARELRNVIERFATLERVDAGLLFASGPSRAAPHRSALFEPIEAIFEELASSGRGSYHETKNRVVEAFHRVVLPRVIERHGGSVPRAADALGIPKASLYRMIKEAGADGGEP